jgi:hypothetical protein
MKTKVRLEDDPVVREVRAARARLWQEGGGTMSGLARLVKQRAGVIRKRRRTQKKQGAA